MFRRSVMRAALAAGSALLVLPAIAGAGGFATVGLSSLPDGTAPGKPCGTCSTWGTRRSGT